jgi:hypothetical protein
LIRSAEDDPVIDISQQPWWADVLVICLPIVVYLGLREMLKRRRCRACRHPAVRSHQGKSYCEDCFRKLIAVGPTSTPAIAVPKIRTLPVAAKKSSRKGEARRAREKRSA